MVVQCLNCSIWNEISSGTLVRTRARIIRQSASSLLSEKVQNLGTEGTDGTTDSSMWDMHKPSYKSRVKVGNYVEP